MPTPVPDTHHTLLTLPPFDTILIPKTQKIHRELFEFWGYYLIQKGDMLGGWLLSAYEIYYRGVFQQVVSRVMRKIDSGSGRNLLQGAGNRPLVTS